MTETSTQATDVGEKRFVISAGTLERLLPAKKTGRSIENVALVDETRSCSATGVAVLKPGLVEDRDYHLVSEPLWNALADEFGFDWEICCFIRSGEPVKLEGVTTNSYLPAIELFYWNQGMEAPRRLLCQCHEDSSHPVLLSNVALPSELSMEKLESVCWDFLCKHHLIMFPRQYPAHVVQSLDLWSRHDVASQWQLLTSLDDWKSHRPQFLCLRDSWRGAIAVGDLVDARDTDQKWFEARVLETDRNLIKIHFRGWSSKWDEWIHRKSNRLALLRTKTTNWRDLAANDKVQVGCMDPQRSVPKWYDGIVLAIRKEDGDKLSVYVSWNGKREWYDAQDELLCAPGTHPTKWSTVL